MHGLHKMSLTKNYFRFNNKIITLNMIKLLCSLKMYYKLNYLKTYDISNPVTSLLANQDKSK